VLSAAEYAQMREAFERMPAQEFVRRAEAAARAHGDDARLLFVLGAGLHRLGELERALSAFERTLELQPGHVQAISARAALLAALGREREARTVLEEARRRYPEDVSVLVNLGYLLEQQAEGREEALRCYDAALALQPSNQAALMNRGYLLTLLGRLPEAVQNNRMLAGHYPQLAAAHFNLAESLLAGRRTDEALRASEDALALDPSHADACMVRGLALAELGRLDEARQVIDLACKLSPAVLYRAAGVFESNRAMPPPAPDPEAIFLHRGFRHLLVCDWTHRDFFLREFESRVRRAFAAGEPVRDYSLAYDLLATPVDRQLHRQLMVKLASQFAATARRVRPVPLAHAKRGTRLRIGYVSPDFREHLNARLTYPILRLHDRSRFEVLCYSLHADDGSEIRKQVAAAADGFVDVSDRPSVDIAEAINADGVDILVDLAGITTHSQPDIFAFRPAPLQVSYLGFPGTLGADYIQYRITDRVASPPSQRDYWSEKLVFLPDTFYIYDDAEPLAPAPVSRREYGLPEDGLVYCVFHNYYKIDPEIFDVWARILKRVDGSVLWFMGRDPVAVDNLKREATLRGVAPGRLCFAPVESRERYRARFRLADLYLDAHRFNAMTTACDALWAGLPILTCAGASFPSRVCASLLAALGLDDCILPDLKTYECEAVRLSGDRKALRALSDRVAANRLSQPLFDAKRRVRQLERAFEEMWERHAKGMPPEDFEVAPGAAD
jgi:predicted O-linked N-acetylglucosamine transferase (SPINDLY family)